MNKTLVFQDLNENPNNVPKNDNDVLDENLEKCFYKHGRFHYYTNLEYTKYQPKGWYKIIEEKV